MNQTWRALANEAALAAQHIGSGVTALGKANYAHRAYFPEAFFALSVGFERSGKLAFVINRAIETGGDFPDDKELRDRGHDLSALLTETAEIAAAYDTAGDEEPATLPDTAIHQGILEVLTGFATNLTRYYNLDVLTGSTKKAEDPISAWWRLVTEPVLDAHYTKRVRERREGRAEAVSAIMGERALIRHSAETGEVLDSAYEASLRTGQTEFARPWERVYVLQIARFIYQAMARLNYAAIGAGLEDIPYLTDFYRDFGAEDRHFKSKKDWSIYR
jgi:hypothetical protein